MRIWSAAVGMLVAAWRCSPGCCCAASTDAPAYEVTLKTFDDFALAEASLQRDVVQARAGLLRDYDSLVKAVETIREAVAPVCGPTRERERLKTEPIDRLAAAVAEQEDLTERFKSSNALVQNSLSYVGLLSTGPAFGADGHTARQPRPERSRRRF